MDYTMKRGVFGLVGKVTIVDKKSGFGFETDIIPEEITTDSFAGESSMTMSFSPIVVPELERWRMIGDKVGRFYDERIGGRTRRGGWNNIPKKIILSGPCTIILWEDGTKTMARVSEDEAFDPEKGVAVCFMKRIMGHTQTNKLLRKAHDQYSDNILRYMKEESNNG